MRAHYAISHENTASLEISRNLLKVKGFWTFLHTAALYRKLPPFKGMFTEFKRYFARESDFLESFDSEKRAACFSECHNRNDADLKLSS